MKAIYFPQTVVQEAVLEDLFACFSSTEMIQPCFLEVPPSMSRFQADGFLSIRPVMVDHANRVSQAWKAFQTFSRTQGSPGDLKTAYFSGLSAVNAPKEEWVASQIATLLQKEGTLFPVSKMEEALFRSALFLYMAQQHDIQNFEIQQSLVASTQTESALVRTLLGDEPLRPTAASPGLEPIEDHMASERLSAWVRLFFHEAMENSCGEDVVWASHSRSAVELLVEHTSFPPQTAHIQIQACSDRLTDEKDSWKAAFQKNLENALQAPEFRLPESLVRDLHFFSGDGRLAISVYAIQENPATLFGRTAGFSFNSESMGITPNRTLLVHLTPRIEPIF